MKHILEQALVALLNENPQDAEKLFHQFIDQRAKEINEGAGTFGDGDGEDEIMVIDGAVGELEFIFPEGGQYGYSEGNSTGVDRNGNEQITVYVSDKLTYVTIEDCADLQTDQESLKAYFAGGDQIANQVNTGFDMSDYAESVEPNLGEAPESDYDALDNDDWDDVNSDDDEFNRYGRGGDLEESFKLAQVTAAKGDGREQGDSRFKQNSVSPVSGERGDVSKLTASPVKIKSEKVSGYDKESAPSVVTKKVPMAKQTVVKK